MNTWIRATVVDAGGGCVEVLVDRDTATYPEVGTRVLVIPLEDAVKAEHERRRELGENNMSDGARGD